ncbi:MAG: glutamate 5-kinase [Bacilli bacterium]
MKKIVIKIGSSSLVTDEGRFNTQHLQRLASTVYQFKSLGYWTIIVTSGAIAMGMGSLGLTQKPKKMAKKQACAALGQARLMHEYQEVFASFDLKVAQILLNHDDFSVRDRMLHLHQTLDELLTMGIVPIINENDALAVEEIKVGDNDTLSSLVAALEGATYLFLISDIDGLYDQNPKLHPNASRIQQVYTLDSTIMNCANDAISSVGTGGMKTKLQAAKIATSSGVYMAIIDVADLEKITDLTNISTFGTLFYPQKRLSAKNHWLLYRASPKGSIVLDEGASLALSNRKSVLPKGICRVEGHFLAGSVVNLLNKNGTFLGRGLTHYSSDEINQVKGYSLDESKELLGILKMKPIVHADELMIGDDEDVSKSI